MACKLPRANGGVRAIFQFGPSGGTTPKSVFIIDDDLGFVFWLGHLLDAAAYLALPAKSILDATKLLTQLNVMADVLIINLALAGAVDFTAAMQHANKDIRVIGVLNDTTAMANIPRVNAIQFKSIELNEETKLEWLQCVQGVLAPTTTTVSTA